jgi:hypothetical protein
VGSPDLVREPDPEEFEVETKRVESTVIDHVLDLMSTERNIQLEVQEQVAKHP